MMMPIEKPKEGKKTLLRLLSYFKKERLMVIAVVLIRWMTDNTVKGKEDLAEHSDVPVLAEIPAFEDTRRKEKIKRVGKVKMVRSAERATSMDYIERIFQDFRELHGDRCFGDDHALVGGLALISGRPVTILANLRGKTLTERIQRNFGMPKPEGYRKAIRLMKQAEKFGRPVISFINTSGAFCGIDAEERGQGHAIAESIMTMAGLKVPVLSILVGEGGSGGALAIAAGSEVWMMEHATYALLSPEGYSAILWKTEGRAEEAAELMKLTAQEMAKRQVIERIIPEFGGATAATVDRIVPVMYSAILDFLERYDRLSPEEIAKDRYERFRKF
jgi:acetyl-CoA carboxylase carboxyl transferase subunit beta